MHRTRRRHGHLSLVVSIAGVLAVALTALLVVHSYQHHASAAATRPSSSPSLLIPAAKSLAAADAVRSTVPRKPQLHLTTTASAPMGTHPQRRATHPQATVAPRTATGLPLHEATGNASQVITVVASSTDSTTATIRAWTLKGSKWVAQTPSIAGDVGSDGLSTQPSESRSATPIGSFRLTQAFGADANPGTSLPYVHTNPFDWWISQTGPLYNTHQRCSSNCQFTQGSPNEHLYFETPFYNYAVVIDYNTPNAGPVVQGAGSAFFLHVSNGTATAGCVSIPESELVAILRWLNLADHPRILIGIGGT